MEGRSRVVKFRHNPSALFESLDRLDAPPSGLPPGDYEVRIYVSAGDLKVEWEESAP
jgi:hypothetical protein